MIPQCCCFIPSIDAPSITALPRSMSHRVMGCKTKVPPLPLTSLVKGAALQIQGRKEFGPCSILRGYLEQIQQCQTGCCGSHMQKNYRR